MTVTPITQIEALAERLEKAREIVGQVSPVLGLDGHHVVAGSDGHYLVNGHCTCPDARFRRDLHKGWCKHMLAVAVYREAGIDIDEYRRPAPDAEKAAEEARERVLAETEERV